MAYVMLYTGNKLTSKFQELHKTIWHFWLIVYTQPGSEEGVLYILVRSPEMTEALPSFHKTILIQGFAREGKNNTGNLNLILLASALKLHVTSPQNPLAKINHMPPT